MSRRTSGLFAMALLSFLAQAAVCAAADPEVKTAEKRDTLLYVRTVPPGAKVLLDGKELGTSDGVFHVEPGVGTIIVELDGHKANAKQVTIRANGITRVELALKPKSETLDQVIEQAVTTISQCGENDPRVEQALKSLQPLEQSKVVAGMIPYLNSSKDTIRRSAIYILWEGKFADITPAVATLEKLLKHEEMFTRGMAALALGKNRVSSSFDSLAKMATSDSSGYARRCAAIALGWMGDRRAESTLETVLKDTDPLVRTNARAALDILCANPGKDAVVAKNKHVAAEKKAVEAAEAWLALVDQGQYEQSWDAAAEYFKKAVGKQNHATSLNAVRKPLGAVKSRQLKSKQFATNLPGAPDGEYVLLQFTTSFDNKASATETITPMLDKDGKWKVSGYYVK